MSCKVIVDFGAKEKIQLILLKKEMRMPKMYF